MMLKNILSLVVLTLLSGSIFAQSTLSTQKKVELKQFKEKTTSFKAILKSGQQKDMLTAKQTIEEIMLMDIKKSSERTSQSRRQSKSFPAARPQDGKVHKQVTTAVGEKYRIYKEFVAIKSFNAKSKKTMEALTDNFYEVIEKGTVKKESSSKTGQRVKDKF